MLTKRVTEGAEKRTVFWPAPLPSTLEKSEVAMGRMIAEARQGSCEAAVDRERLAKITVLIDKSRER